MSKLTSAIELLIKDGVYVLFIKILERKFWKLISENKWAQAIKIGEMLLKITGKNLMVETSLAVSYQNLNQTRKALNIIENAHGIKFSLYECLQIIENGLREEGNSINSKYTFLGGWENIGFFEHEIKYRSGKSKTYLTKISTKESNEVIFFKCVYEKFPNLKSVTPEFANLDQMKYSKINLITTKKIEGNTLVVSKNLIERLVKITNIVISINYEEIYGLLPKYYDLEVDEDNFPSNPLEALRLLSNIHKESTNHRIFNFIYKKMSKDNYSYETINIINRLEKVILTKKFFSKVNPKLHYSLQHGDLKIDNIIMDRETDNLYLIDWGYVRVGPRWNDMAGFLGQMKFPFEEIKNHYLKNSLLDSIGKVFFVYALILTWIISFPRNLLDSTHEIYMGQAIDYLESSLNI
jgi:thiamine kinase-like enzyme